MYAMGREERKQIKTGLGTEDKAIRHQIIPEGNPWKPHFETGPTTVRLHPNGRVLRASTLPDRR